MKLDEAILEVLRSARVEGNLLRLPDQLDRKLYEKVDQVLRGMGGKWKRGLKGHLFPEDPAQLLAEALAAGESPTERERLKRYNFFPTPPELGRRLLTLAAVEPGMEVGEPSAGDGALADLAAEMVGKEAVHCVELQGELCARLRAKGYRDVQEGDFLQLEPVPAWDAVVMNPPFRNQADIRHVLHAYRFLKAGGRLAAVMSAGTLYRENGCARKFREFLEVCEMGREENPPDAFRTSGTEVVTVTVVLEKHEATVAGAAAAPEPRAGGEGPGRGKWRQQELF